MKPGAMLKIRDPKGLHPFLWLHSTEFRSDVHQRFDESAPVVLEPPADRLSASATDAPIDELPPVASEIEYVEPAEAIGNDISAYDTAPDPVRAPVRRGRK